MPREGTRPDPLLFPYPAKIHAEYLAGIAHLEPKRRERRKGEPLDFGGVENEDLFDYYEKVMGHSFEWRESNARPKAIPFMKIMSMFSTSPRERATRNAASKDGGVYGEIYEAKKAIESWTEGGAGGVSPQEALAAGNRWLCPRCGYVPEGLHGEDELMHCPELECDEVLSAALPRWIPVAEYKQQAQRRVNMAYEPIKCGDCGETFQRHGKSQGNRKDCYTCRPKGSPPKRQSSRPGKTPRKPRAPKADPSTPEPTEDEPSVQTCRTCGCSDDSSCETGDSFTGFCTWSDVDLCSECVVPLSELKAEAEALVKVADALEGLDKNQVGRVLGWAKQAVL